MRRRFTFAAVIFPLLLGGCGEPATPDAGQEAAPAPRVADPEPAVSSLIKDLGADDPAARTLAQKALLERLPAVRPDLRAALAASAQFNADARLAAALLLCRDQPAPSPDACLGPLLGTGLHGLRDPAPVSGKQEASAYLLERSREGNAPERADAMLLLASFGPEAIDPLLAGLDDDDLTLRAAAAVALSHIRDPRLVEPLLAQLTWAEDLIEKEDLAAWFGEAKELPEEELPEIEDEGPDAEFVDEENLTEENPAYDRAQLDALAAALARALQAQGAAAVRPVLEAESFGAVHPYRVDAILHAMPREQLVPSLVALLADPGDLGTLAVAEVLAGTGDPAAAAPLLDALAKAPADEQPWWLGEILRLGAPGVESCLARLDAESPHVRAACIRLLAQVDAARYADALRAALADPDTQVVAAAADGLGQVGAEGGAAQLLPLLSHRDGKVRTSTASSLGGVRDPTAVPALIAAIAQLDWSAAAEQPLPNQDTEYFRPGRPREDQRLTARPGNAGVEALAAIGAPAVPAILDALEQKPETPAAARLVYALADIPAAGADRRTAAILGAAIDASERHFQAAAVHALAKLKPEGWLPALMRGLERERKKQAGLAPDYAVALGGSLDSGAAEILIASLSQDKDDGFNEVAINALSRNDSPPARAWLQNAFAAKDLAAVAAAYYYFISLKAPGSEETLIVALNERGHREMATSMLNSGNDRLQEAARDWADKHNYNISRVP